MSFNRNALACSSTLLSRSTLGHTTNLLLHSLGRAIWGVLWFCIVPCYSGANLYCSCLFPHIALPVMNYIEGVKCYGEYCTFHFDICVNFHVGKGWIYIVIIIIFCQLDSCLINCIFWNLLNCFFFLVWVQCSRSIRFNQLIIWNFVKMLWFGNSNLCTS